MQNYVFSWLIANGKHMLCGGLSMTNLSVHTDLYFMPTADK
jgi:hypothetical protein